jgi:hypothetical protein
VGTIASEVGVEDRGEKRKKKITFEPWCQILEVGEMGIESVRKQAEDRN